MHHGKELQEIAEKLEQEAIKQKLGATGEYPEGNLVDGDEGEIRMGIAAYQGKVVLNFGKPVAWMGFDPNLARQLARSLIEKAAEVEAAKGK